MAHLELNWTTESANIAGCPAVIVTDGVPSIVAGTDDGDVIALDGAGKEVWRTSLGATVSMWPVVDTVPGYGPSILAGTQDGVLACLSPDGDVQWKSSLEGSFMDFTSVSVLRGGGGADIVATNRNATVSGLSADGECVWRFVTHTEPIWRASGTGPAAVGDIDGDGVDEIFFTAAEGYLYCLNADGAFRWSVYIGHNSQYSGPVLADLGSGPRVCIGGTLDSVRCIDAVGDVTWSQRGAGAGFIEVGLSVGDISGDGRDDIAFVHQGRALQAVDGEGDMLWSTFEYVGGDQPFGPSIADIDGDGKMELLLSQRSGVKTRIVRSDGSLMEEQEIPGGMSGGPVVADVDGDGLLEVLMLSISDGELRCFNTSAPARPEAAPWPTSRGPFDGRASRLTGGYSATEPVLPMAGDEALTRTSPNEIGLGINEIGYESAVADAICEICLTDSAGVTTRIVAGEEKRAEPRIEILEPGQYLVEASLIDPNTNRVLGITEERVDVSLFASERAEAGTLLDELKSIADADGELSRELQRTHRLATMRWWDVNDRIAAYGSLSNDDKRTFIAEVAAATAAFRREIAIQRGRLVAAKDAEKPVDFLPWQTEHPWCAFDPDADVPTGDPTTEIEIRTDGRGHEAVAIQIANALTRPLEMRASMDQLADENGSTIPATDHFELRRALWIVTPLGGDNADALPELGNAGILPIGASSSARLWIDVLTRDLPPGTYTTTLHLRALSKSDATWDIAVRWTVEPIALPEAMPLYFCNWANGYTSHFAHVPEAALEDMQDHYTSIFSGAHGPRATYDADGNITDVTGWEAHNAFLDQMRPQNILLLGAYPLVAAEGAPGPFSDAWKRAFATFLPRWVEHLAKKGFGYDRWAFYPVDEPGLMGGILIERLEEYARFVKGLDPKAQIYTDPYRGMTVADHKQVLDVLDIVQPTQYFVVLAEETDRIDFLKSTDQTHWIYEARAGVKDDVEPRYYWEQIWAAWELGFTGVGYWTYCTTGFDLWESGADYTMVYQGAKTPVPSVRWQAIRIGIEDYARMARLRDAIDTAREAGRGEEADRAMARLNELVSEARAALWNPGVVARIRNEVMDMTLAFAK